MSDDESEVNEVVPQPPPPDRPTRTTTTEVIETSKAWFQVAKSFAFVELSALVLMFATIAIWNSESPEHSYNAYALSVAVISLAACLSIQTWEFLKPGTLEKVEKPLSLFLFLWWGIGTFIITFKAPTCFTQTSNGWFSAWAGLIFTAHWALQIDITQFKEMEKGRKLLMILLACSFVLICACISPIRNGFWKGQAAWGLSAGVITLVVCIFLIKIYDDVKITLMKVTAAVLFVMWSTVAGVCTFDGPFIFTGKEDTTDRNLLSIVSVAKHF